MRYYCYSERYFHQSVTVVAFDSTTDHETLMAESEEEPATEFYVTLSPALRSLYRIGAEH